MFTKLGVKTKAKAEIRGGAEIEVGAGGEIMTCNTAGVGVKMLLFLVKTARIFPASSFLHVKKKFEQRL